MKLRKILSTLLAAALVCGLACTAALAEEPAAPAAPDTVDTAAPDVADPAEPTEPAEPAESTETDEPATPSEPVVTVDEIPAEGTAIASTQNITVDGTAVEFAAYALEDANGNRTNYVKLRDVAVAINGTDAQFEVGFDGSIILTTKTAYTGGADTTTPFSGDHPYKGGAQTIKVDGKDVAMTAITLYDENGGGYNYFKLRDLGAALGFNVDWSAEKGIFVETDKPYGG